MFPKTREYISLFSEYHREFGNPERRASVRDETDGFFPLVTYDRVSVHPAVWNRACHAVVERPVRNALCLGRDDYRCGLKVPIPVRIELMLIDSDIEGLLWVIKIH